MWPTPVFEEHEQVYEPAEDSFFLLDSLESDRESLAALTAPLVLEIGSGSGIVSSFVHSLIPQSVAAATDINPVACDVTAKTFQRNRKSDVFNAGIEVLRANLVPLRPQTVDVLIFNPPYVPSEDVPQWPTQNDDDKWLDLALDGGKDGMEITTIVLDSLDKVLSVHGYAYILFCARNHPQQIKQDMQSRGWDVKDLGTRRAGWEVLTVLRFSRGSSVAAVQ